MIRLILIFFLAVTFLYPFTSYDQEINYQKMNSLKIKNMKTLIIIILAGFYGLSSYSQEDSTIVNLSDTTFSVGKKKNSVTISDNEVISVDENNDTTRIKIGKKGISIVETPEGTKIDVRNLDESETDVNNELKEKEESASKKFKGHWSGIQLGLNNYVNSDFSTSLDNSMNFMDLNTGKSWTYSLNILKYDFGLGTDKIGIVTGLGFEWSNYSFDKDYSLQKDSIGKIIPFPLTSLGSVLKNKLSTTYLTVPLLLEFQIPAGKKRIYFSGGPIGAIKLGSHTKVVYKEDGDKKKIKDRDDFNLSSLRYGFTARAGYRGLNLFATYYLTPLFESNKGPELYPFSVGLTLIDF